MGTESLEGDSLVLVSRSSGCAGDFIRFARDFLLIGPPNWNSTGTATFLLNT